MSRPIKSIDGAQLLQINLAVANLRDSCKLLRQAGAMKSLPKARAALKSAEGAMRHAHHRYNRTGASR